LFTYVGVLIMIMQFIGGTLVNRFGEVRLIQAGLLLSATGFFLISLTNDWLSLLVPLAIFVAGNAVVFPGVMSLITKKVQGKSGAVLGLNNSFSAAGQFIGPLLGGFLFGINHFYSFAGMAAVVLVYFVLFTLFAGRALSAYNPHPGSG
jgi:MFS family permease